MALPPQTDPSRGQLSLSHRSVANLSPDPHNACTHTKREFEQIAASIRAFGFSNPILIHPAGAVIAGHGRLLAAESIGLEEVPTVVLAGLQPDTAILAAERSQQLNQIVRLGGDLSFRQHPAGGVDDANRRLTHRYVQTYKPGHRSRSFLDTRGQGTTLTDAS
jgi:hypothetical protein